MLGEAIGTISGEDLSNKPEIAVMVFDTYGETEILAFPLIPVASKIAPEIV